MPTAMENLLDWLRDAHAAEEQAKTMLTGTVARVDTYPMLKERLEKHIEETARHAELVQSCIDRLGSTTSTIKDTSAKLMATAQSLSGHFVSDEVVKAMLATYSFECMEIASYTILKAAARQVDDEETFSICEQILREEEAMALWLLATMPEITQEFLMLEAKAA
jgi:ferritin-like metal-binding protein YciE